MTAETSTAGPMETWANANTLSANQFSNPLARCIALEHLRPFAREQDAALAAATARIAVLEAAIRSFLLVGCVQEAEDGPCAVSRRAWRSGTQSLRAALAGRETG